MSVKLARVVGRGLPVGEPLPDVFPTLRDRGVRFFRGGTSLVGGTPGSMKSMFIGELVERAKVPTLYFSNDNNEAEVASRFIARRIRMDSIEVRDRILEDPQWGAEHLADMDWVRWDFNTSPTLADIEEELMAFEELYGEFPHLVVVDILIKVDYAEEGGGTNESIVRYLDNLARQTNSHILIAHHTSENMPGNPTPSKASFLDKITKMPVLALTCAYDGDCGFFLAPVKNRSGWADATGDSYFTFYANAPFATLEELS